MSVINTKPISSTPKLDAFMPFLIGVSVGVILTGLIFFDSIGKHNDYESWLNRQYENALNKIEAYEVADCASLKH